MAEVLGVTLAATNFDLGDAATMAALRAANLLLEDGLAMAACSTVFHALHASGVFETVCESEVGKQWP